jgi:ketosteroid isomerase-like protein
MFERYTEKARRVVFFARYEASQYGAKEIATEHLLLGLMREDRMLMNQFLGPKAGRVDLRADMAREITRGERVSTSVEMPLSAEGKKVLTLAGEEAQRMGRRQVSTEHLLLALLGVKGSLAERTLVAHGMKLDEIRQALVVEPARDPEPEVIETHSLAEPIRALTAFLDGLSSMTADLLLDYFADDAAFIDWHGKRWNRTEIDKTFDDLFVKYAKKNATYLVEMAPMRTGDRFVVSVLWRNALLVSERRGWMHRMGMVWVKSQYGWQIGFAQVTVVDGTVE